MALYKSVYYYYYFCWGYVPDPAGGGLTALPQTLWLGSGGDRVDSTGGFDKPEGGRSRVRIWTALSSKRDQFSSQQVRMRALTSVSIQCSNPLCPSFFLSFVFCLFVIGINITCICSGDQL